MAERGRPQMAIWRMLTAYWIPKATDTHSEYATPIAFPRQEWLRERASMLHFYIRFAVFKKSSHKMVPTGHPDVRQTDRPTITIEFCRTTLSLRVWFTLRYKVPDYLENSYFPHVSRGNLRPQVEEGRDTRGEEHTQT